jgi:hypothetical protein
VVGFGGAEGDLARLGAGYQDSAGKGASTHR